MNIMTMWGICSLEMDCDVITLNAYDKQIVRFMLGLFNGCYSIWGIHEYLVLKNIREAMEWTW